MFVVLNILNRLGEQCTICHNTFDILTTFMVFKTFNPEWGWWEHTLVATLENKIGWIAIKSCILIIETSIFLVEISILILWILLLLLSLLLGLAYELSLLIFTHIVAEINGESRKIKFIVNF